MKTIALLSLLVLSFGCASSPKLIDHEVYDCSPGHDIEVRAGIDNARNRAGLSPEDNLTFLVEVANNSHEDVIVDSIRIEPDASARGTANLDPVFQSVNQDIAQGKDHLFRFPVRRRLNPSIDSLERRGAMSSALPEMTVTIVLKNGDAYRCPFSLQ